MRIVMVLLALCVSAASGHAGARISAWTPLYKGVEHALGTNDAAVRGTLSANLLRIDLQDPDVQLLVTPPITNNYLADSRETLLQTPREFLEQYELKVAVNGTQYSPSGYQEPSGKPANCVGLLISEGRLVSPDHGTNEPPSNPTISLMLFTANNAAAFIYDHATVPADTNGVYTVVSGLYPLLSNGVNMAFWYTNAYSDTLHQAQPRTALGLSEDGRYLILLTVDGRQGDFSDGALDHETAEFLLLGGASNGMNMDGGGSACMVRADACGRGVELSRNSFQFAVGRPGAQRSVGSNFGVRAGRLPGFISDLAAVPGTTTADIRWTTAAESTSQVEFGLTSAYGQFSASDPTLVTQHAITLTGLLPGSNYFFRVISLQGGTEYSAAGCFRTTNFGGGMIFNVTNVWKYSFTNLDGINWKAPRYDDSSWPQGPGLLYNDNGALGGPKSTLLPLNPGAHCLDATALGYPYPTYYFRTHFAFSNDPAGVVLTLSNYLDDGAVFYLNGVEIHRAYVPAGAIPYCSLTTGYHCSGGDATCPFVVPLSADLSTNLVYGDNVLAVEVHNYAAKSPDIVFGAGLLYTVQPPPPPVSFIDNVAVQPGETTATVTWTTISNSTSRVEYGLTPSLGSSTPLDPTLVANHSVVLTDLLRLASYYFRVISSVGATQYTAQGTFATQPFYHNLVPLTHSWRHTTNNLEGMPWTTAGFNDSTWPQGPALLHNENNTAVAPRNTLLPLAAPSRPWPTYYFRSRFQLTNDPRGLALLFSNFVDDGAVFHLNGSEIGRLRMPLPPATVLNRSLATGTPSGGDAISADVFRVPATGLVGGENVLAVEVHQNATNSADVVFGSAIGLVRALASETTLRITRSNDTVCVEWDGGGLTLQQSQQLGNPASWADVPGPVKVSPYCIANPVAATFFRLRN